MNLTCVANGSPMPVIKWTKGDEDLSGPDDELPVGQSILILKNVQETAQYTCYAMSDLGEAQQTVTVTVRSKLESDVPSKLHVKQVRKFWIQRFFNEDI